MIGLTLIRRLLAIVAIAGLVLAPVTLSVSASAMKMPAATESAHAGMAMPFDMECCPKKQSSHVPDCGMDCPFMALCMGVGLQNDRVASLSVPLALVSTLVPGHQRDLDGLAQAPPIRPPKA
jgi:hypothetical protein